MNYRNRGPGKPDNTTHRTKKINTAGLIRILIMLAALLVVVGIAVFANNSDGYGVLYPEGPEHTYIDDYDYEYYSHIHDNDENYENEHYYMDGNIGYAPEYDDGPYYYQGSYYNEYLPETGYEEYHEGGYSGFEPSGGYIGFMPAGFTNTPTGPFDYWNGGTPVMDGAGLESAISAAANPGFTRVIYIGADITMTGNAATRDVIANRDIWIRSTAGNNYVIMSSGANRHFNVSGGGRLTLSNITLSRQIIDVLIPTPPPPPATPPPPINFAPPTGTGGGVAIGATGTLVMENGAVIRHNRAANGGGVDVNGANAVFHMNGGTIRNNQADGGYGGGVRVTGTTSTFHFNGGTIGGDHSTPLENLPFPSSLTHSAADSRTPAGNARPLMPWSNFARSGGGLFVNAGATVIMNRPVGCLCINNNPVGVGCTCTTSPGTGEIVGNIASDSTDTNAEAWAGGGIRVSGNGTSFRMYGGAIRGNYSGNNGGGVLLRNTGGNTTTNRSVFHFMGGYIEENISVRNRSAGDGGGGGVIIGHFSSFYMYEGATVRGNYARTQGAGVRLRDDSARFIMYGGSIIDNRVISVLTNANGGGAGINLSSASGQAGQPPAVVLYSGLIAYNSTISTSTGLGAGGGGIAINRGDVHIRGAGNVVIRDNVTPGHGGGIVWHDRGYLFTEGANFRTTIGQAASAVVNPANANTGLIYITGNTAGINPDGADQVRHGGGIHIAGFGFNGSNFRINNNTATAQGGGVFTADVVILRDSHINLNTAGTSGGGIHNASEVRLYRSNVNGNNAGTSGGGIHTTDTVHLQQTTINGNTAVTTGGGVHTTNNVTVLGSTIGSMSTCGQVICICVFLGNSAGVDGGGLYVVGGNNSVVTINSHVYQGATTHSFIENNTAERNGGGVYFRGTATGTAAVAAAQTPRVTMYHGYIRGNTARGHVIGAGITQGGGGVFIHGVTGVTGTTHGSAATFTMHNGAISYNTAIRGGGLFMSGAHREVPSTGLNTTQTGFSHGGHFVFHGGEISDNRAVCRSYYHPALGVDGGDGAGVYMDGAVRTGAGVIARLATAHGSQFDMHGGYIENNRAARHGGGVFLDRGQAAQGTSFGAYRARGALFTMNTGHIRGNTAGYGGILAGDGGGVYLDGLTLYDNNTIHDDTVARFYMTSGSIDGNTATRDGGGIFIGGGRRQGTDNTVGNANEARGGRVRIYGTSSISDNTAHRNGGGVFLGGGNRSGSGQGGTAGGGRLYMHDTTSINENRALDGGGIFIGGVTDTTIGASSRTASSAILTMQGQAIIEFNTARHRGGGVHLAGNQLPATTNLSPASPRFVFNAGSVANNTANFGGGFFVGGGWRTDTTDPSQNGVIHGAELHIIGTAVVGPGNRAMCATYFDSQAAEYGGDGGGVYVTGGVRDGGPMGGATGGVLRFGGGGTVQGNIAHRNGGGVVLRPGRDIGSGLNPHTHSHPGALLSMNGGHILENIAGDDGGGLWIP
ncbi:MAG: hypothetical protein FWC73_13670, partial [Defluviitaleaceae bacterium]|nr:hypothetical protein [Defluviitaleaceae bacterium]